MRIMKKRKIFFVSCLLWVAGMFSSSILHAQTYTLDVQAEEFFASQLKRIDSIRVMDSADKALLREHFVCYLLNNADLKWSLQLAMSRVSTYPLYYLVLFKEDILLPANREIAKDIRELRALCNENDTCYRRFIPVIRRKNEDIALFKGIYVTNDSAFFIKQQQILAWYELQKKNFVLSHSHYSRNYDLVLKSWKRLDLNDQQIDSILAYGKELKSFLTRNEHYDFWKHERTHRRNILTENQYDIFLTLKHQPKSTQSAYYYWGVLKEKKLAAGMDSISTIREITNYYIERNKLFDLYAYEDREKYKALFAELYRNFCPVAVRRVNEVLNAEKNTQKIYQGTYSW